MKPTSSPSSLAEEKETNSIQSYFENFKEQMESEPDLNEVISLKLNDLGNDSFEFTALKNSGVPIEKIKAGQLTRQELIQAGFAFINTIGGGSKPIIKATINGVNYGKRRLITQSELEAIQNFQKESGDFYPQNVTPSEIAKDMYQLLISAPDPRTFTTREPANMIQNIRLRKTSGFEQSLLEAYIDHRISTAEKKNPNIGKGDIYRQIVADDLKEEYPWPVENKQYPPVRGVPSKLWPTRAGKIANAPSPFLDSGLHFSNNIDLTIHHSEKGVMRHNLVNVVLANRGLSQMGDGGTTSHDQRYITMRDHEEIFYPSSEDEKKKIDEKENRVLQAQESFNEEEVLNRVKNKLLQLAHEWLNEDKKAPLLLKARRSLGKIFKRP